MPAARKAGGEEFIEISRLVMPRSYQFIKLNTLPELPNPGSRTEAPAQSGGSSSLLDTMESYGVTPL